MTDALTRAAELLERHGESALAAELRAMAWQPIETAPRGEPVLVGWSGSPEMMVSGLYGGCWSLWRNGPSLDPTPTKWRPLPPPPLADTASASQLNPATDVPADSGPGG